MGFTTVSAEGPVAARARARVRGLVATAALSLIATLAGFAVVIAAGAGPRDPSTIAAVFPPWWSEGRAAGAAASAGAILTVGAARIFIIKGDPATLQRRLRAAGALLLLDPQSARGCGFATEQRS